MKLDKLAKCVADIFITECIGENYFDNFCEMKKCYMWDSADIKEEVASIIEEVSDCWLDDEDCVGNDYEITPYKTFIRKVYAELKKADMYE